MPTHQVNLDALIKREDFEYGEADASGSGEPLFKLEELDRSKLYYKVLRKPDFQRETSNWNAETIVEFVRCFLDGELIPAIIVWHSQRTNKLFVIDGSHRVSALIAWVNDDYGDGVISREFFGYRVPAEQVRFHKKTKSLMEKTIGSFAHLLHIGLHQERESDPALLRRALAIATRQPPIQKVIGDATIAEKSFFKINGNPATIDPVELDIIRARKKPNAIATRALMRAGRGHKYWAGFSNEISTEIERLAQKANELLFGDITDMTSQSPDLPRAGQPYSEGAFKMILDMVNIFNDITPAMWQERKTRRKNVEILADDIDGKATLTFLNNVIEVGNLLFGNEHAGSLGLDPAVYCYGSTGRFHPAAYLATMRFAQEVDRQKRRYEFTSVRNYFEDFLVTHKSFINDLGHTLGSRTRSLEQLLLMYTLVLDSMISGERDDRAIVAKLMAEKRLKGLKDPVYPGAEQLSGEGQKRKKFSKVVQDTALVRETLSNRPRCPECGARLPPSSRSKDHIRRIEDGGIGTVENLQFTHPYCNTGYKEAKTSKAGV